MKRSRLVPLGVALACALPAVAQEAPPAAPEPPAAAAAPLPAVADLLPSALFPGVVQERPEWMEKTVSLAAEERPAAVLVKEILEKVGLKRFAIFWSVGGGSAQGVFSSLAAKDEGLLSQPFGEPVTLKLENVRAEEALRKTASAAGVRMTFTQEDGLTRVDLAKTPRSIKVYTIGSPEVEADAAVRDALLAARDLATTLVRPAGAAIPALPGAPVAALLPPMASIDMALGRRGGALPDRRVSLDVREREAREVLKDLLKQAQVDYVLEEDLPDRKVTLAFKNSPVAVALDVVCNTLGVGWRSEREGKKTLVRIGAKYRHAEGQATLAAPLIFTAPARP